ncbi:aminotransferase class V-fold PLP-dependent enzyme [Oscillatoria amoena NRMC-F 0135]|nr:aminotransferase class V-fold PLP-dependent enzyme [Oscillatoria amoena NRMC-F 0135]
MKVYFDNAATTPLDAEVLDAMLPVLRNEFGNPSSTHAHGRSVRSLIEDARKRVAKIVNVTPSEYFLRPVVLRLIIWPCAVQPLIWE